MDYLDKIRKLPDGLKSRVIQAAHKIADKKRHEHVGPGAVNAAESILYYDEDTWTQAWTEVQPLKDEIHTRLMALSIDSRYYWCSSMACACMGCANYSGVTKGEWAAWVKENPRPPTDEDGNEFIHGLTISEEALYLNSFGKTIPVIRAVRDRLGCGLKEARDIVYNYIAKSGEEL